MILTKDQRREICEACPDWNKCQFIGDELCEKHLEAQEQQAKGMYEVDMLEAQQWVRQLVEWFFSRSEVFQVRCNLTLWNGAREYTAKPVKASMPKGE